MATKAKSTKKSQPFKVPRTEKELAAAIQQRMKRSPDYWRKLQAHMDTAATPRVAQVMPREGSAAQH